MSKIFTVPRNDESNRPVLDLKKLKNFIHCLHFKIEGLFLVRELLSPNDWMYKLDLKDAYFSKPIHRNLQKNLGFIWKGYLYQFFCLCFGLSPGPLMFTKLLKVPIALLRKLKVMLIIYLDDILLMAASKKELEIEKNTLTFLLQHLGFVINVNLYSAWQNNIIPWDRNKFDQNGIIPLRRKSSINSNVISENIGPEINICNGGLSVDRNIILSCPSSTTGYSQVSLPTETTNRRIMNFSFLRKTNSVILSKESRDSMVGSHFVIK